VFRSTSPLVTTALIVFVALSHSAAAQTPPDVWRSFAERVDVGTELNVRLSNGQRFRATLIGVQPDAVLLQPKTRVPVPVQAIPYDGILRLERTRHGIGGGKAVAIGVATGVGAFFATLGVLLAVAGD
jgi:hypothetical protein